jgi:thioredoxin reductase (NADPH)
MEEALFLTRFASSVTVIHRRDTLRASKIMQERALSHPKIKFIWNAAIDEVLGENAVEGVRIRHLDKKDETSVVPCEGLFVAIGHEPNTAFLKGHVELDEKGYLVQRRRPFTETSVPGVFSAGDVQDVVYRQAITAAGSGCQAAIDAERYLERVEGH